MSTNRETDNSPDRQAVEAQVYDLYDEYCHGGIDRREFLRRAGALVATGTFALAFAQSLLPRHARAQTITFFQENVVGNAGAG